MNSYFARDIVDYRHAECMNRVEQARRYHAARSHAAANRSSAPRAGAVRRPFAALHTWLVAGVL